MHKRLSEDLAEVENDKHHRRNVAPRTERTVQKLN